MPETVSAPVVAPTLKKKWNVWVITGAILAVSLTGVGLGVGLSQFQTTSTPAQQKPGFVMISGAGQLTDSKSYVSGSVAFPAVLPLQTGAAEKFATYESDGLTPKPSYAVGTSSPSGSNLAAGTDLTDQPRLLTKMRAGETIIAKYDVVDKTTNAALYSFQVTYAVQPRVIVSANESLYDDVSFRFDTDAQRMQAVLPVVSVKGQDASSSAYLAPVYKDQGNNAITTDEQLRSLPVGSTFTATYTDTHDGVTKKYVVTYVISVK